MLEDALKNLFPYKEISLKTDKRDNLEEIFFKSKLLSAETRPPKSLHIEFF